MRYILISVLFLASCSQRTSPPAVREDPVPEVNSEPSSNTFALVEAKRAHQTKLNRQEKADLPVILPPVDDLELVNFTSVLGSMPAYISKPADTTTQHPAIVWVVGGFQNSISEVAWEAADPENDQSARVFREMGVVTLYPSMRGGNQNPGHIEYLYGEVDDVIAAARFLATVDYVDPSRIYLGGHSTGGTLALLAAESTDLFRAVFALGPVGETAAYGPVNVKFDIRTQVERDLRAPIRWLDTIDTPTYVIEGTEGNISSLRHMQEECTNDKVQFFPVAGHDHFNVIAPVSRMIAREILADTGHQPKIDFSTAELGSLGAR